jgi:hypothetical protein
MKMVGHKTESICRRYAIADEKMIKEAGAKLAIFHAADKGNSSIVRVLCGSESGLSCAGV